jgi:Uma2 family endonuclease
MTQTRTRFRTFEEYAALDPSDLPEGNYELVNGAIVEMGAENDQNLEIAMRLVFAFARFVSYELFRIGSEIAVSSESVTSRFPDLVVLTEALRSALSPDKRSIITLELPPPKLVVEVVSPGAPGSDNYKRDYVEKPQEYAKRGIPEFWLVDPTRAVVLVLTLAGSSYEAVEFRGSDQIRSDAFRSLNLTAQQILSAG